MTHYTLLISHNILQTTDFLLQIFSNCDDSIINYSTLFIIILTRDCRDRTSQVQFDWVINIYNI